MTSTQEAVYRPGWRWAGRSLENYKAMQAGVAKAKGVSERLIATKTLTQARKVVYGTKPKQTVYRG